MFPESWTATFSLTNSDKLVLTTWDTDIKLQAKPEAVLHRLDFNVAVFHQPVLELDWYDLISLLRLLDQAINDVINHRSVNTPTACF